MPYDLYGTYYSSERDALNAEMAQCAAIDASIALRDQRRAAENDQAAWHYLGEWQEHIESRLRLVESFMPISLCEGDCK